MKRNLSLSLSLLIMAIFAMPMQAQYQVMPALWSYAHYDCYGFHLGTPIVFDAPEGWEDHPVVKNFLEESGCVISDKAWNEIKVVMVDNIPYTFNHQVAGYEDETYTMSIANDNIYIEAITRTGVIRAFQTLAQLSHDVYGKVEMIDAMSICDWPAFKVRGFMHDVGRSFITIEELKKEIDLLSRFKVNTFHWHLTEHHAWRFEVKAFPALTAEENMTRFPGKYYTAEECREVEEYAWQRGMIVIPEIDMPGHSTAFEKAMGHKMQTAQGIEELQTILEEVAEAFPHAPYIHIGADETSVTYPGFIETMTTKIHSLGKKTMVWNPASNVAISADKGIDATQMWSSAGKVVSGMPNIDCRYNYVNHFDVFADLVGIFKSNIYYTTQGTDDVAGFVTGVWNDRKTATQEDIIAQNNFYANVLASNERAWCGGGKQYIETGGTMLPNEGEEYEEFCDWERRFLYYKDYILAGEPIPYVKQTNVRWRITDAFPNNGRADAKFPPETDASEVLPTEFTYNGRTYGTDIATGAGIYLRHTWGTIVPGFYANPQINHTAYAWTYVYSPVDQEAGALVEFQNYSRSEHDQAPENGLWDRKGSRLWINDEEIPGPDWDNAGKTITKGGEDLLLNENLTAREPVAINLKKGWNKVFMKLPYVNANGVRLNKWMFTFVITDPEGRNSLDGLRYSPDRLLEGESGVEPTQSISTAPESLFTIDGRAVDGGNPAPGIYIRRSPDNTSKILIP